MDEALKRRLVGVLVVIVAVFIISLLLPHPGTVSTDENNKRVTLDLTGKEPEPMQATPTPVPPVIAAAPTTAATQSTTASNEDNKPPQIEEPPVVTSLPAESMTDDDPLPAKTVKPVDAAPAKPKPEAVVAAAAAEKPAPVKAEAKPTLKLEDSLKQKPAAAKPAEKTPPKAAVKAPVVPAKVAAAPAAASSVKKHWFVQLGAFNDIGKARQVLEKLGPKGLKGIISPLESDKGTLYRARIGPLSSRDQAKHAQEQAAKLGFAASSVIED